MNNVLQLLERDAELYPDKIALEDEDSSLTYAEYMAAAKKVGSYLCGLLSRRADSGKKIAPDGSASPVSGKNPVVVLVDRNIKCIAAFMGVVYSGNFYVPLDPAMPSERIELILNTLFPAAVIDARKKEGGFKDSRGVGSSSHGEADGSSDSESDLIPVVLYSDIIAAAETDDEALALVRSQAADSDPLYSIFTSGSTGVPKGILKSHRGVLNLAKTFSETFSFSCEDVFGNQSPFDFDVSAKDIYSALYVGGTIDVLEQKLFMMPKLLIERLAGRRIDNLFWAVSALRIVSDIKAFDAVPIPSGDADSGRASNLPALKNVMFSGEILPIRALKYWMEHVPCARYINLYGPTEVNFNCAYYVVDREFDDDQVLPIGRPFKNTQVLLVDTQKPDTKSCPAAEEVPPDTGKELHGTGFKNEIITLPDKIGELCVAGDCVTLGYFNDPKKTAAAFVKKSEYLKSPGGLTDHLVSEYNTAVDDFAVIPAEAVIYKTGDLGYYNENGEIVFVGRSDYQIKHMGHRIELGEIEAALNAIPFLTISCCLYDKVREKIVCFYQAEKECRKEIVLALSKKLPKYMWPNVYKYYEKLPSNRTGKIDRAKLAESLS